MRTLIHVVLIVLCVLVGAILVLNIASYVFDENSALPLRCAVVLTGSMEPSIRAYDMVVVVRSDDYAVDDVVMIQNGSTTTTHRIVVKTADGFITRGDANNTPDTPIQKEDIIGKVVLVIPQIGVLMGYIKSPYGIASVLLILVVLGVLNKLYYDMRLEREDDGKTDPKGEDV